MAYTTRQDLDDRIGVDELLMLTDPSNSGLVDEEIIARAMEDADAEIDGYIAGLYSLPLVNVPSNLIRIAVDIARFRLWNDRASEEVRRRYDDAVRYLERVANGSIRLSPDLAGATTAATGGIAYAKPCLAITDETMSAY